MERSALSRLRALPDVFSAADVARVTGLNDQSVRVSLARWGGRGLVQRAGLRSGIYYNLLRHETPNGEMRRQALLSVYPSAVLIGVSVLHAAGWITQIPQSLHVAVRSRRSYIQLAGFEIRGRSPSWFRAVDVRALSQTRDATYGLRSLTPADALADLYGDSKAWHPDPDDLDLPDTALPLFASALERLEVQPPSWLDL